MIIPNLVHDTAGIAGRARVAANITQARHYTGTIKNRRNTYPPQTLIDCDARLASHRISLPCRFLFFVDSPIIFVLQCAVVRTCWLVQILRYTDVSISTISDLKYLK